jgi:hypothetical protein
VVLLPAGFLVTAVRRPRYALLSSVAIAVTCVFAASYANASIQRYYLGPAFFAWTWIAVLASAVADRIVPPEPEPAGAPDPGESHAGSTPEREPAPAPGPTHEPPAHAWGGIPLRTLVAGLLGLAVLLPTIVALDARWREADRSQETWVTGWVDDLYAALAPDAVLISWWSYSTPAWYGQLVEGRRPDVFIIDDRTRLDLEYGEVPDVIDRYLGERPVYVIRVKDSDIQSLAQQYAIEPVGRPGNVFRVTGRLENQP